MPDEKKPTGESKHPSCRTRGKIQLEVYGKEMVEWKLNGHDHQPSIDFMQGVIK